MIAKISDMNLPGVEEDLEPSFDASTLASPQKNAPPENIPHSDAPLSKVSLLNGSPANGPSSDQIQTSSLGGIESEAKRFTSRKLGEVAWNASAFKDELFFNRENVLGLLSQVAQALRLGFRDPQPLKAGVEMGSSGESWEDSSDDSSGNSSTSTEHALADLDNLFSAQEDEAIAAILETMDGLWVLENDIQAVFIIEDGMDLGCACRKAADLLALHPKLKAPIYLVSDRKALHFITREVNRPINKLLKKPLEEKLRFLSWENLQAEVQGLGDRLRYLKPEFLEALSEGLLLPGADAPS
jgi:hypothetical protein